MKKLWEECDLFAVLQRYRNKKASEYRVCKISFLMFSWLFTISMVKL